jgi:hypothetical protein
MRYALLGLLAGLTLAGARASLADDSVRWTVTHEGIGESVLVLGPGSQTVLVPGDWRCTISEVSDQLPAYQARQTLCTSGDRTVEFSVQCEADRPKDNVQLRFRDAHDELVGYIDVGCKLQKP